jgi:hypothetical protein
MTFYILSNTFLEAPKLHLFKKKILDTLEDALMKLLATTNELYSNLLFVSLQ